MLTLTTEQKVYYILRLSIAMCFIGHGAFGIITKPIWCNYFAVFGINHTIAYQLMPIVGTIDVLMGLVMFVYPVRAFALWLVIWGVVTASLRPLSGEPFAEFIERAGNFGAPLAFLLLCGKANTLKGWFTFITVPNASAKYDISKIKLCLKAVVFLLLTGHGWLNLICKPGIIAQYHALGITQATMAARYVGCFEIAAAMGIWFNRLYAVLLILFIWKVTTELLYPHYELLEFIERGGSYGTILALWLISHKQYNNSFPVSYRATLNNNLHII